MDDIERPLSLALDSAKSVENPSNVSTVINNKVSKEELNSISQVGAFELFALQIISARTRKLAWSLSAISTYSKQVTYYDVERTQLIDQINELRYEKHSLLEDNNTLRHHNENLIENLEKTNLEFQALSLNLDNMRLVRMVRVVSKMIEVPMAEAFFILYDSCLDE
jgi:regulator of replication initiation timing